MENNSKPVVKYKSLTSLMFLFYVIHPITLCGMFTRSTMPARFRPNITPAQKAIIATAEKEAEEDRKAEEENLERIRLMRLKLQEEAQERGEKRYTEILQEGQRAQFLKSIRVQASDGITTIPLSIVKRSDIFKSMISDLGGIPKDPIPLPHSSLSVIRDVCNIIPQRFINPEKIEKQIAQYSLQQLVERFNFVHYLKFPQDIQNLFKKKIIQITQGMSFQRVIDNKDAINMIDSDIPEFKSLTKMAKIPYVTIMDGQSGVFYIPEHIYTMSEYLLGALRYNKKKEIILDKDLADSLLKVMDIINFSQNHHGSIRRTMEYMGHDSIRQIIPIINCLDYLGFSENIKRAFHRALYSLCKELSFNQLVEQLADLSPNAITEAFCNPIVDKLKFLMLEKTLRTRERKIVLDIVYNVAFSPDNKMFAVSVNDEKILQLWSFNDDDEAINLSQELYIEDKISTIVFSPNNKKLVIGTYENNILIYDIDSQGSIINKNPQVIAVPLEFAHGLKNNIKEIALSPNGLFMVAVNKPYIAEALFLWSLDKNGIVNKEPQIVLENGKIISPIQFNDDGTLFIAYSKFGSPFTIGIFNDNCSLESEVDIKNSLDTRKVIFYRHDKKCIAISSKSYKDCSFHAYDFKNRDKIIKSHVFDNSKYIKLWNIFNDSTVFAETESLPNGELLFISLIDKRNSQVPTYKFIIKNKPWSGNVNFRPDCKKVIVSSRCDHMFSLFKDKAAIYTILTDEEEKKLMDNLKKLDGYQSILIDKMLSGATDLPSLEDYEVPQSTIDLLKSVKLIP